MMAWNRESAHPPTARAARNSSALRHSLTDAEKLLWNLLRDEVILPVGTHFRRQLAIGPYVVDFVCLGTRLVVEVDGPIHRGSAQVEYDAKRDLFLQGQGFRVFRFMNEDLVLRRTEVIHSVSAALAGTTPTPSPYPQGGGEQ
jgi:very-short-patch-repair endonuclease